MKPVEFEQSNFDWNAPVGQGDAVGRLRAYKGVEDGTGWPVSISCWEISQEELNEINLTKQVWLRIYGAGHPVVSLSGRHPWGVHDQLIIAKQEELEKLRKFKAYTHEWLDKQGVPADPDPERNKQTGCRLECRLDWLEQKIKKLNEHERSAWLDGDL